MKIKSNSAKPSISAIIIAKNEEKMIANCIETLKWCDEILVIDNGSEDTTAGVAENLGARVVGFASDNFSRLRNEGLKRAKTDWIFYVDADERVLPELSREILVHIETTQANAMKIKRNNIMYGQHLLHGGWENDTLVRVFRRSALEKWQGKVHESPVFEGEVIDLFSPLLHLTHRNTRDGLIKSSAWTEIEAELLFEAGAPAVTKIILIRKVVMEFVRRYIQWQGYQDGMVGFIESLIQAFNKLLIYVQLWELQQKPTLPEKYQTQELKIADQWRHKS